VKAHLGICQTADQVVMEALVDPTEARQPATRSAGHMVVAVEQTMMMQEQVGDLAGRARLELFGALEEHILVQIQVVVGPL
jgi:hypothetical protein